MYPSWPTQQLGLVHDKSKECIKWSKNELWILCEKEIKRRLFYFYLLNLATRVSGTIIFFY